MSLLNLLGGAVAKTTGSAEPTATPSHGKGAVAFAHAVDDARRAAATDAAPLEESAHPGESEDGTVENTSPDADATDALPGQQSLPLGRIVLPSAAGAVQAPADVEAPADAETAVEQPEAAGQTGPTPIPGTTSTADAAVRSAASTTLTTGAEIAAVAAPSTDADVASAAPVVTAAAASTTRTDATRPAVQPNAATPATAATPASPGTVVAAPSADAGTTAATDGEAPAPGLPTPITPATAEAPVVPAASGTTSSASPATSAAAPATDPATADASIEAAGPAVPAAPAATATAPAQSAPPVARPALLPQISGPVLALTQAPDGDHQLTLTISPENLGPVTVRAHISGGAIHIELHAPTDLGRDALRTILADLRRDLAVAASHATLAVASHDGGSGQSATGQSGAGQSGSAFTAAHGQGSHNGGAQNGSQSDRGLARDSTGARATPDEDAAATPAPFTTPHGGIDVYA
ncbi:flagellar hook-length control protein FliK [Microbacterium abyssi]|uniref:flagellar hook-length control protein FliK n=1 Tax=Microbacterium abyssi TaxID=2782166 RepID=UPI00188751F5|nr:flagellar hook-length control protein FliK [Microbacterium sp. A18JL241]